MSTDSDSHRSNRPKQEPLVALDALRSMAALAVVLAHVRGAAFPVYGQLPAEQQGLLTAAFYVLTRLGYEAVLIFFALSGFLVGGQIIRQAQQSRFDVRGYFIDRATRIYLPLLPAVAFAASVQFSLYGEDFDLLQTLGNLFALNGIFVKSIATNGPLWTLAYEIWFYIIGGSLAALLVLRRPAFLIPSLLAVAAFSVLNATLLLIWVVGATMVALKGQPSARLLAIAGLLLFATGTMLNQVSMQSTSIATVEQVPANMPLVLIGVGAALTLPLLSSGALNRFLAPLRGLFIGLSAMSYSLYLFHYPTLKLVEPFIARSARIDGAAIIQFVSLLTACLLVSWIVYMLFERQTGRLRSWLKARTLVKPDRLTMP